MARFHFRFGIPEGRFGERGVYDAYVQTLDRLTDMRGAAQTNGTRVEEVHASSGSVIGSAMIEAPSYESALEVLCRETPILDLEWHVEEWVEPKRMTQILGEALKRKS